MADVVSGGIGLSTICLDVGKDRGLGTVSMNSMIAESDGPSQRAGTLCFRLAPRPGRLAATGLRSRSGAGPRPEARRERRRHSDRAWRGRRRGGREGRRGWSGGARPWLSERRVGKHHVGGQLLLLGEPAALPAQRLEEVALARSTALRYGQPTRSNRVLVRARSLRKRHLTFAAEDLSGGRIELQDAEGIVIDEQEARGGQLGARPIARCARRCRGRRRRPGSRRGRHRLPCLSPCRSETSMTWPAPKRSPVR